MLNQIEDCFQKVKIFLENKKEQIIKYFKEELIDKVAEDFMKYEELISNKLSWLK